MLQVGKQYVDPAGVYSVELPEGWDSTMVRGAVQVTGNGRNGGRRHTIVIRASQKPAMSERTLTVADFADLTEVVVRGLPRAKLEGRGDLARARLPGALFTLTFVPRGSHTSYRRTHALLVGSTHLFHVIYTSPAAEPVDESAFNIVVRTLTEGV